MPDLPLFVFGTLRRGAENHHYLAGNYDQFLVATLSDFRRTTAIHGFPAIIPSPGDTVQGELYFLRADRHAETLRACDTLEDIPPGETAGEFYRRATVRVETPAGQFTAWAYLAPDRDPTV